LCGRARGRVQSAVYVYTRISTADNAQKREYTKQKDKYIRGELLKNVLKTVAGFDKRKNKLEHTSL